MADYRTATTISTERLTLTPLRVEDADEMALVLSDRRLHEFIGGYPATLGELRDRYGRLVVGARSPGGVWLNWIVRVRPEATAVGTVQATVTGGVTPMAAVAWVIGVAWQGQGLATEAARALVGWLQGHGVEEITANIHPDHLASMAVAAGAGLQPTVRSHDGETVWRVQHLIMRADQVLQVLDQLAEERVTAWVDGGWGVDTSLAARPGRTRISTWSSTWSRWAG